MYVARSIVFSERFEVDLLKLASFSSTCYTCRELFFYLFFDSVTCDHRNFKAYGTFFDVTISKI